MKWKDSILLLRACKKMRIVLFVDSYLDRVGGVQQVVNKLSEVFQKFGNNVVIVCGDFTEKESSTKIINGIRRSSDV